VIFLIFIFCLSLLVPLQILCRPSVHLSISNFPHPLAIPLVTLLICLLISIHWVSNSCVSVFWKFSFALIFVSQFYAYPPPVPLTILSFFPLRHFHFVNSLRNSLRQSLNPCLDIYSLGSYSEKSVFVVIFSPLLFSLSPMPANIMSSICPSPIFHIP